MNNTKLIKLLKILSVEEFKRLHKGVQSSLLTTNPNVIKLYHTLRPFYPNYDSSKLDKEKLFRKVFPTQSYKDGKMRKLMTEFTKVIEDFLIYNELEAQRFQRQKLLTRIYGKRNLYPFFEKNTFRLINELDALPYRDEDYYWQKKELEQQYFFHPITPKVGKDSKVLYDVIEHLNNYYMTATLKIACELSSRAIYLKEQYELPFLDMIQEKLLEKENLPIPYKVYLSLIDLLKNKEVALYWNTRKVFFEGIAQFSLSDKKTILYYLFNFAIAQVNKGNHAFRVENFELYKFALAQDLLIDNNYMSDIAFTNIVSYGASLNEIEWTVSFIQENKEYLPQLVKEEAIQLSWAYISFFQKNYLTTIDILLPIVFHKISHKRRARSLLLRSYFELSLVNTSYLDIFFSFVEAYQKSLYRNMTDSGMKIQSYLNLVKYLKKIASLLNTHQWRMEIKQEIIKEVKQEDMVLKPWILERLHEL